MISKNSNQSCQNIYSSETFLQLLCIMHRAWHYKLQSLAKQGYSSWYLFVQTAMLDIISVERFCINPVIYHKHLNMSK